MDRKMTWRVFGSQTLVALAVFVNVATASDNTVERRNTLSRPADQDGHLVGRTSPNLRPVIQYLSARLYGSYLIVSGNLTNVTGDPTKWTVLLSGSILGTAPVQPDGSFISRHGLQLLLWRSRGACRGAEWGRVGSGNDRDLSVTVSGMVESRAPRLVTAGIGAALGDASTMVYPVRARSGIAGSSNPN